MLAEHWPLGVPSETRVMSQGRWPHGSQSGLYQNPGSSHLLLVPAHLRGTVASPVTQTLWYVTAAYLVPEVQSSGCPSSQEKTLLAHTDMNLPLGALEPGNRAWKPPATFTELGTPHTTATRAPLTASFRGHTFHNVCWAGACTLCLFQKFPTNVRVLSLSLEEPPALTGW